MSRGLGGRYSARNEPDAKAILPEPRSDALKQTKTEIKKADIKSRVPSKLSSMPEGLVNILTKEEILDLVAYLESAGKREHAAFAK